MDMATPSDRSLRGMAWMGCVGDRDLYAWDETGVRVCWSSSHHPPITPLASSVLYGAPLGDAAAEMLDTETFEERLGFSMSSSLIAATPELLRGLPLDNLPLEALPSQLIAPPQLLTEIMAAIRAGCRLPISAHIFVSPDDYGGHGLFAVADIPANTLVGEYVGTLLRVTGCSTAGSADPFLMRYPDVSGSLHVSAKETGSLMRFVNHAEVTDPSNNCRCCALLIDGAYHTYIATSRRVAAREQLAFDYGAGYWATLGRGPLAPS